MLLIFLIGKTSSDLYLQIYNNLLTQCADSVKPRVYLYIEYKSILK